MTESAGCRIVTDFWTKKWLSERDGGAYIPPSRRRASVIVSILAAYAWQRGLPYEVATLTGKISPFGSELLNHLDLWMGQLRRRSRSAILTLW